MSSDRSRARRQLAEECLAAAKRISDVQVRASLFEMAQKWLDLAERREHDAWNNFGHVSRFCFPEIYFFSIGTTSPDLR
jgi:type IV pilus biogenesis protein CpaD/CtpE